VGILLFPKAVPTRWFGRLKHCDGVSLHPHWDRLYCCFMLSTQIVYKLAYLRYMFFANTVLFFIIIYVDTTIYMHIHNYLHAYPKRMCAYKYIYVYIYIYNHTIIVSILYIQSVLVTHITMFHLQSVSLPRCAEGLFEYELRGTQLRWP
jgi:hypothetical protein